MTATGDVPPVGSAAEEAARLAESLRGWFASAQAGVGARDGVGADAGTGAGAGTEHTACTSCLVCLGITRLRAVSPEVVEHLSAAAGSLVAALRELRAPGAGPGEQPRRER